MRILFSLFGIVASVLIIKYREALGDTVGQADWMDKIGGVYNLIILFAVFVFFWSLAALTNTQDIFFLPILWLLPGMTGPAATDSFNL